MSNSSSDINTWTKFREDIPVNKSHKHQDLNVSLSVMGVDQSVSLAFPSELLIFNSVLADQRAVCCYNWPDRDALPSDQLWLKLKPGFNPWHFTCQSAPSRHWSRWVTSRCALLDVTARHFRLFAHKSLYVWLPLCQPHKILFTQYSFTYAVVMVGYASLCWHTCRSWAERQMLSETQWKWCF